MRKCCRHLASAEQGRLAACVSQNESNSNVKFWDRLMLLAGDSTQFRRVASGTRSTTCKGVWISLTPSERLLDSHIAVNSMISKCQQRFEQAALVLTC